MTGKLAWVRSTVIAQTRSLNPQVNASAASAGRHSGSTIRQKTRPAPAPSISAVSSTSRGIARMKPCSTNVQKPMPNPS